MCTNWKEEYPDFLEVLEQIKCLNEEYVAARMIQDWRELKTIGERVDELKTNVLNSKIYLLKSQHQDLNYIQFEYTNRDFIKEQVNFQADLKVQEIVKRYEQNWEDREKSILTKGENRISIV